MKSILAILLFAVCTQVVAQKFPYHRHNEWEESPEINDRKIEDAVYYYNKYSLVHEYIYDSERGSFFKYETVNYRVFMNTDAAVEEFNKMYISLEDVYNVLRLKVRLIKPSGIVELEPEVEEFYNEDEGQEYYYFPISGMEKGDELEIKYTLKKKQELNGAQELMQGDIPIFNSEFIFITPKFMNFNFKGHNGYPTPEKVDTILQRNQHYAFVDTIPVFKSEIYSEYNNSSYKIDMALGSITEYGDTEIYSPYERITNLLNSFYNIPLKGSEKVTLLKKLNELNVVVGGDEAANIRLIENFMKLEMNYSSAYMEEGVKKDLKAKFTSTIGLMRLYKYMFDMAGIKYRYGFISDRYDSHFDKDFESEYYLQNYIFYFPSIDEYMAPLDFSSRLGFVNDEWIPNNALLAKENKRTLETSFKIRPVPAVDYRKNSDSLVFDIEIADNLIDLEITISRYYTGYQAGEIQSYYYLYSPDRKETKLENMLNYLRDKSTYTVTEYENVNPEDAFVKPLIVKGKLTNLNTHLIEKAGDKTIFKLGNIFGDWMDIKEIKERHTDFCLAHPYISSRTVNIKLPNDVMLVNKVNVKEFENLSQVEGVELSSEFTQNGQMLTYKRREAFKKQRYSKNDADKMAEVFQFYNDIADMNLILVRE